MTYPRLAVLFALLLLLLVSCGPKPLLNDVAISPTTITPNADGITDLARIQFHLNQSADVAIYFQDQAGQQYTFRPPTPLSRSESLYTVYFGGVVDGFTLPSDPPTDYTLLKRMLPDGVYTWEISADTSTEQLSVTGLITITEADTSPPAIRGFSIFPRSFSPNQDGIDDRVTINLDLKKDVEDLTVYLLGPTGTRHHIPPATGRTPLNQAGWHSFDYDGGIDSGAEPPPDGEYVVYTEARDRMGQRAIATDTLTIYNAGLPRAYILNADIAIEPTTLVLSDTVCFTLTVENDSNTYIRTIGPWPGETYRSDQNFNTLGWSEESGVYRVGMDFDTSLRNYPFRWGIGTPGVELVQQGEHWYLPPFARSVVTGCIQIVEIPPRNPFYYWGGLIHEDVEIAAVNNRVDPHQITVWEP